MAEAKLSAPVGLDPRESPGKPVRNKSKDVVLVRQMLDANGIGPLGESKSMDSGLLKAIKVYQKKIGFKVPDMVIDPDGRTFKKLKAKFLAKKREEAKVVMYEVTFRQKKLLISAKDLKNLNREVFKQLGPYMKTIISTHKCAMATYEDYLETAQLKDGILNAVSQAIVISVGSVKWPDTKIVGRSIRATGALERAISSRDLAMLNKALPEAEKAINAFNAEIRRFLKDFTGSAQTTATVLGVTSAASFAVVGALAVPVLVTGAGLGAGTAAAASGAGVGVLQSASQELGKHASGQKVTVWDSVRAVVIDGTIGGLTGGIGAKIPLGFIDDAAKALAPKLAAKVTFMTTKQLEKFIANYLAGSGQEAIKSAIGEAIKLCGKWMKSGKTPTEKDFKAAVEGFLYSLLLGGMVKNLGRFQTKWAYKNKEVLQGTIFPARLAKLAKGQKIPNTLKAKMWSDVMNKVSNEAMKAGFHEVFEKATGKESDKQLSDMAARALMKDKKVQALIDRELKKALKKNGIPVK